MLRFFLSLVRFFSLLYIVIKLTLYFTYLTFFFHSKQKSVLTLLQLQQKILYGKCGLYLKFFINQLYLILAFSVITIIIFFFNYQEFQLTFTSIQYSENFKTQKSKIFVGIDSTHTNKHGMCTTAQLWFIIYIKIFNLVIIFFYLGYMVISSENLNIVHMMLIQQQFFQFSIHGCFYSYQIQNLRCEIRVLNCEQFIALYFVKKCKKI
eukprot:TRINITY_DN18088_c0_g1_i4.p2 TRINITY_DN18088_c0_g1~~TRINITY_DN18088_c0_g1_i4.p2  ORF type:complete len:208 (-),score=-21.64 TRINITY_DN18088_c0_g1_i4:204-827(-)